MKKIISILLITAVCLSFTACNEKQTPGDVIQPGAMMTSDADEPAGTAYIGKVGSTPAYEYYFNALLATYVTEAMEKEPGYEKKAGTEAAYDFMVAFLAEKADGEKTNLQMLAEKTAEECRRMVTLKLEGNKQGTWLKEAKQNAILSKWDAAANAYLERYQAFYPSIRTRDDVLRLLYHMNVNEVKSFSLIQSEVSEYIQTWYATGIRLQNEDLEAYYKAHLNDFRVLNLRVVCIKNADENGKALAEDVACQIKASPERMENLVKGYNQDKSLAAVSGKMAVTGLTPGVPAEIKTWAYVQTEATLFDKSGNVDVLTTEDGYYVVLCESIAEYVEETENAVYESVGKAYKKEKLDAYLDELEKKPEYAWTECDADRVNELAQIWVSSVNPKK